MSLPQERAILGVGGTEVSSSKSAVDLCRRWRDDGIASAGRESEEDLRAPVKIAASFDEFVDALARDPDYFWALIPAEPRT